MEIHVPTQNSECYIFNRTPEFFFISHLHWLHWVTERLYVFFTTPSLSTCVSKGSGRISDGCGNDAEKEVSGDPAWLLLSLDGYTFRWLLALLSTFSLYTISIYTTLVIASHGRNWKWVLEDIKALTKNVYTFLLTNYSAVLLGSYLSAHSLSSFWFSSLPCTHYHRWFSNSLILIFFLTLIALIGTKVICCVKVYNS